jgi:LysM repeat protein
MVQATKSKATLTSPVTRATKATDVASRSPGERPNGVEFEAVACVTGDKLASCAAKYGLRPADLLRLNTALNDRDVNDPLESDLTLVVPLKTRH